MEPQAQITPEITPQMPAVTPESLPVPGSRPETLQGPAVPELEPARRNASLQAAPLILPQVQVPLAQTPVSATVAADSPVHPLIQDAPVVADDVDVIEKEWVDKAKSIVEKTKNDPHEQNQGMSALKADYMKKRYGKDIKLTND